MKEQRIGEGMTTSEVDELRFVKNVIGEYLTLLNDSTYINSLTVNEAAKAYAIVTKHINKERHNENPKYK